MDNIVWCLLICRSRYWAISYCLVNWTNFFIFSSDSKALICCFRAAFSTLSDLFSIIFFFWHFAFSFCWLSIVFCNCATTCWETLSAIFVTSGEFALVYCTINFFGVECVGCWFFNATRADFLFGVFVSRKSNSWRFLPFFSKSGKYVLLAEKASLVYHWVDVSSRSFPIGTLAMKFSGAIRKNWMESSASFPSQANNSLNSKAVGPRSRTGEHWGFFKKLLKTFRTEDFPQSNRAILKTNKHLISNPKSCPWRALHQAAVLWIGLLWN